MISWLFRMVRALFSLALGFGLLAASVVLVGLWLRGLDGATNS
jgi:hypothetical protein